VLVKGGHLAGDGPLSDVLVAGSGTRVFEHPRVAGPSPRGTGCALATAIAVGLGRGDPLEVAIQRAATWLAGAIAASRPWGGERHLGS
jgi:hydroxymethylpyrimidine/phosphomethylpyrimidine kinase